MKVEPPEPTTVIPELLAMPLSEAEYRTVVQIVHYASRLQEAELNPTGGPKLRWRIEIAAAFLVAAMGHSRSASTEFSKEDKLGARAAKLREKSFVNLVFDLAEKRAREIDKQGHA